MNTPKYFDEDGTFHEGQPQPSEPATQEVIELDESTGKVANVFTEPNPQHSEQQEWTREYVRDVLYGAGAFEGIAAAHNAALTAERERVAVLESQVENNDVTIAQIKLCHKSQLAAERQRRVWERHPDDIIKLRAADTMAKIVDKMVESNQLNSRSQLADARLNYGEPFKYPERDELYQQLLSAQAAIEKIFKLHGNDSVSMMIEVKRICRTVDLSLLDQHDTEVRAKTVKDLISNGANKFIEQRMMEVRKPLVEELKEPHRVLGALTRALDAGALSMNPSTFLTDIRVTFKKLDAALAQCKKKPMSSVD